MSQDESLSYQLPPQEIVDLVDSPPTPYLAIDPGRTVFVMMARPSLPTIEEVGKAELRLAGLRIDPETNGPSRVEYFTGYTIRNIRTGDDRVVTGVPEGAGLGQVRFAPDGRHFVFSVREDEGLSLWVADVSTGSARRLTSPALNGVLAAPSRGCRAATGWCAGSFQKVANCRPSPNRFRRGRLFRKTLQDRRPRGRIRIC